VFHVPNKWRVRKGEWGTVDDDGNNGVFHIPNPPHLMPPFRCIASDGLGWEHVSVSLPSRTPTWSEMEFVCRVFWDDDDAVVQYHPPRADWVNMAPTCLHLWRPVGVELVRPPTYLVGFK